ncbi:MAG: autotransporter outer membrane beta-barrel domain-containing protein [Zoogloeaceae bacterium]|jgi:hypothetical protein|nr:autotransporter outer membrane beta-barrel domain-containing protein [Zoogloeaceae bacterium]
MNLYSRVLPPPPPRKFALRACALCFLTALPTAAFAQQNISITTTVSQDVYGNGSLVDGDAPSSGDPSSLVKSASGNTVTVSGSVNGNSVYGGYANTGGASGEASGNTVDFDSAGTVNNIYGGYNEAGHANQNRVDAVLGDLVTGIIAGGDSASNYGTGGDASDNVVNIRLCASCVAGMVYGGNAEDTADRNIVVIDGDANGQVTEAISGKSLGGQANHNVLELIEGKVTFVFDAGHSENSGADSHASDNTVRIRGGEITNTDIAGGYGRATSSGDGYAERNQVLVTGGTMTTAGMFGGRAHGEGSAYARDNRVEFGLAALFSGSGGMNSGKIYGGSAEGVSSSAFADRNEVTIDGAAADTAVYGGYARGGIMVVIPTNGSVSASGNEVIVRGSVENLMGDAVVGGYAWSSYFPSIASENTVRVLGGTVTATASNYALVGGQAHAGGSMDADASRNTLEIDGGTVIDGRIVGGVVTGNGDFAATRNSVTIKGATSFTDINALAGGEAGMALPMMGSADFFTGNTLNLHTPGLAVGNLYNFEKINFYLPANFAANDVMLYVEAEANLTDGYDEANPGTAGGRSSVVHVGIDGAASPLQKGDEITLIAADTLVVNGLNTLANGQGMAGVTLNYEFDLDWLSQPNYLLARVRGVGLNPQTKSFSEGFLSGLTLINQGADLVSGQGVREAAAAVRESKIGRGTFAAISGGKSRYDTGSHADVDGYSLMAGLSWGANLTAGRFAAGAFFEYGSAGYDTYNSFANAASVKGSGDLKHYGAGILGRMDYAGGAQGHFYAEASARLGREENDYKNRDMRDAQGRKASYEVSGAYYGLHAGAGYVMNLAEGRSLDVYGKYFWARESGDSTTLSTGERLKFKAADSSRLRLGGRYTWTLDAARSLYAGLAWEHEFDGVAKASASGFAIAEPKLRGDTGMAEFGFALKPSASLPLFVDVGVQGYGGKRKGATASARVRYEF